MTGLAIMTFASDTLKGLKAALERGQIGGRFGLFWEGSPELSAMVANGMQSIECTVYTGNHQIFTVGASTNFARFCLMKIGQTNRWLLYHADF